MTLQLEQGDAFERRNADWIRATLPRYEETWAAFIGKKQSGQAKPMDIPGLTPEQERSREEFYQAHYSLARKLLLLTKLSTEIVDSVGEVRTYKQFEETEDHLFRYGSYLGFIFDMFERMEIALNPVKGFCGNLRSFYNQRHHIIHTPQIPHTIDANGIYMIPRIASEKGLDGQWHKSSVWSDIKDGNFVCLAEFVEETTTSFLKIVGECQAKVFDAANRRFEGRRVVIDESQMEIRTTSESLSTFYQTMYEKTDDSPISSLDNISGQYAPPEYPGFSNSSL